MQTGGSGDRGVWSDRCLWLASGTLPPTYAQMHHLSQLVLNKNRLTGACTSLNTACVPAYHIQFTVSLIGGRLMFDGLSRHASSGLERFSELVESLAR